MGAKVSANMNALNEERKFVGYTFCMALAALYSTLIVAGKGKTTSQLSAGIAISCITLAIIPLYLVIQIKAGGALKLQWITPVLAFIWLIAVGILTVDEPFSTVSNGYFSVWGCFGGSLSLLYH